MYGTFVHCSTFAETANRPYINVSYANSLWCTNSRRIAFSCSSNIRRMVECCLPRIGNISTLNDGFVFAFRNRVLFAFRCKPGLMSAIHHVRTTMKKEIAKNSAKKWQTANNHESVTIHYSWFIWILMDFWRNTRNSFGVSSEKHSIER